MAVRNDALVFRRAQSAALIGLAIQLALGLATGMAALWADSPALYAAGWHMVGGMPIWIMLALLYQQHEDERKQRLAAAKLAETGRDAAAIFGNLSDDLDASQARLEKLYRWGLPIVSGIVALYLIIVGSVLLFSFQATRGSAGEAGLPSGSLRAGCDPVTLMFIMSGVAFAAFVSARWISGYARHKAWQLLRGGASYLMSCFVAAALLLGGAATVAFAGSATVFAWLAVAIPCFMILIGIEVLITALLESYRPKVPGEIPRPAFDSRMLGLLTSPESLGRVVAETISYQFGVEVSRSWVYQLLGTALTPLAILALCVLSGLSCMSVVGPDERGLLLRWGRMRGQPLEPGVHFKLPWPAESVELHPVGQIQQILVSSDLSGVTRNAEGILWTTDGDKDSLLGQEDFIAAPGPGSDGGISLVSGDVIVQYSVADLAEFAVASAAQERLLELVATREVSNYFATHDIDDLLGSGRARAGAELRASIQSEADRMAMGVNVVGVAVTALHPPIGKVSRAFHQQINAVQQRETAIQVAKKDAVRQLAKVAGSVELSKTIDAAIRQLDSLREAGDEPQAAVAEKRIDELLETVRGEAFEVVHRARAYRWKQVVDEQASGEQFAGEIRAFEVAPDYYRTRRFLEVLANGLAGRRKFVLAADGEGLPVFRMDFVDSPSAIDTLLAD